MADVEVGLGAVVGDEDLTVLERVHGARVHVEVRVELLHRHAQAAGLEQGTEAGGGEALAERRGDTPGDEEVLGRHGAAVRCLAGMGLCQEGAPVGRVSKVTWWEARGSPSRRGRAVLRTGP